MRPAVGFFAGYVPTPTVTYKTEGFAELEQALYLLAELHKYDSVTRQVMVKAAEKAMMQLETRQERLHTELIEASSDHERLKELGDELTTVQAELRGVEDLWLVLSEELQDRR